MFGNKKIGWNWIIGGFIALTAISLSANPGDDSSRDGFSTIDLTGSPWYAKRGWTDQDASGFSVEDSLQVRTTRPAIVLNDLFHIPPGKTVNHFAVFTTVRIEKERLKEPLVLQIAWIGENWEAYLNGRLLRREVFLNHDGGIETYRTFRGVVIPLDPDALVSGKNTIAFHIVGNGPPTSLAVNDETGFMFGEPYVVTTYDGVIGRKAGVLFFALYTVYFFFGLYHILLFLRRPRDIYNLFFGVVSLLLTVYGISATSFIYDFFFNTDHITRIHVASQPLLIPSFFLFAHHYFYPDERPGPFMKVMVGAGFLLTGLAIVVPHPYLDTVLQLFYYSAIPMLLYGAYYVIRTLILKRPDIYILAFSIVLLIVAVVYEIIDTLYLRTGFRPLKYSFFAFVMSLVGIIANRFLRVHDESERLNRELTQQKNAFIRFVPDQFLKLLGKQSAVEIALGDNSVQTMSVLMCDLRGFTHLAESLSPEQTFRFLNTYLARMEPSIQRYDGFVDKFIGDAILALFAEDHSSNGRPGARSESTADRALLAAIAMGEELRAYNDERMSRGERPVRFGIGINTGPLVLGTVGSDRRIDTTVIGNTVNLAARLESLAVYYRARILITHETFDALSDPGSLLIREIDTIRVKGKSQPSLVYEVFEVDEPEIRDLKRESLEAVWMGIIQYKGRNFSDALLQFEEALRIFPGDRIPELYVQRCREYLDSPPPESWAGVFEMVRK